jgi:cytochrome c553
MRKAILFTLVACFTQSVAFANEPSKEHVTGDATKGKALSAVCAACHGADGNSVNPDWPKIAGQGEAYLIKQIKEFRSDKRAEATMTPMAKGIASDEDVLHLAAYYASQKTKSGTANKDKVALGEAIYKGGVMDTGVAACSACHGPTGIGNGPAKYPKISGQHTKYLVTQLKNFKSGSRSNDVGKIMRNIALKMTDAEMEAVAEYMSGLQEK